MSDEFYFDPEQQEGGSRFQVVPAGDYTAEIIDAVISQPKSRDGHMLTLIWKISDGDYEGRQIFQQLCYQHSNPTTQDIARRNLKDICIALAINQQVTDPEVFKFKPARVRIGIASDKYGQFDDQNKIKRVRPLSDAESESSAPSPKPTTQPKPTPTAKPATKPTTAGPGAAPWKKQPAA
jgi:hypothetical protein